ncbi:hypothetical protein AK812_SmicGene20200 [Symbiodinium microadriaticum]|uniref:Uncharacterized protein n=1 Tax=Symbiodinium microadriaticum TaxID=2951 RepID=A0A1Q9DQL3_SYMMI|nr:hypothetical protein AK812_SmicGene20200 [Symbiodinium microadriaticum]
MVERLLDSSLVTCDLCDQVAIRAKGVWTCKAGPHTVMHPAAYDVCESCFEAYSGMAMPLPGHVQKQAFADRLRSLDLGQEREAAVGILLGPHTPDLQPGMHCHAGRPTALLGTTPPAERGSDMSPATSRYVHLAMILRRCCARSPPAVPTFEATES